VEFVNNVIQYKTIFYSNEFLQGIQNVETFFDSLGKRQNMEYSKFINMEEEK
jgi:hypothetical protein